MTAAVVPLTLPLSQDLSFSDATAEARKRRREILASQRSIAPVVVPSDVSCNKKRKTAISEIPPVEPVAAEETISASSSAPAKSGKKPQMKYDPDIPMTKEEAAAWRREQRRKRNRESAAASRQRQRDRISELEVEVDDWKSKFEAVMMKISRLEQQQESVDVDLVTSIAQEIVDIIPSGTPETFSFQGIVSPVTSPEATPCSSPLASPVTSLDICKATADDANQVSEEEEEDPEPTKMISRQAQSRIIHKTTLFEIII